MDYAKLSQHGYSQEVRLPKKYRMPGKQVKISRYGRGVLLQPIEEGFEDLFQSLSMFSDDFMKDGRNQQPVQDRGTIFE
ncbi:MAG: AbrB/MazE/SpoVT family DNA-binding domain-containing protein [Moorea sp. SIOASIH]|uniref:antitoxin n=1 Tax=unclassified Moorena TaxID=2683338 RepID=UPI0013BAEAD9|nr:MULTISPECIES: type II toxin-antitoxin system VapB family antitoxin [unclassified Moorena]NEO36792.1 AbrB/MazE/SpoVT family DNA-binding domain-containing protein [Moorena sp. SIOASIH]NEO82258.1 AbrB/MazE/SpoVT family DNA-binding domain-containing protein [Moorena sp. SIO4G3]NEO92353.1 AbrB/MazE/SpoVT family DNA-binding domain-containing protein [Moorena sp. SIO3G5]